jgi:hypothetical protein
MLLFLTITEAASSASQRKTFGQFFIPQGPPVSLLANVFFTEKLMQDNRELAFFETDLLDFLLVFRTNGLRLVFLLLQSNYNSDHSLLASEMCELRFNNVAGSEFVLQR